MTKVFNTHIEAARYLLEKPMEHEVLDDNDIPVYANGEGDYYTTHGLRRTMNEFTPPFTAVEPDKTNEDYIKEIRDIDRSVISKESIDAYNRKWLEIMDEKINKAKV